MAMADPVRQSNSLPSLSYLDIEKIKKETSVYTHKIPISAALNMPAPPFTSPSIYSGPPPPYSYPSSTASSVVGLNTGNNGYISPPESRQTSDHEKEPAQPPRLRSLPSIHEALGNESHNIPISSLLTKTPAVAQPDRLATHRSPTSPNTRSHPETPTRPPPPFSQPPPQIGYRLPDQEERSRPRYSPPLSKDLGSAHFKPPSTHHYPPPQPSRTASSPIQPPKSMAHAMPQLQQTSPTTYDYPRSTAPASYTYSPYHPSYSCPMPPPSVPSYQYSQIQPPPSTWKSVGSDFDRAEEVRKAASKGSPISQSFGETVKRHLDRFDLETSLNEIAEGSGRALSFSRDYGDKAHQTQRSGLSSESMPTLAECDEMLKRQRGVLASMERIREVILKQQQDLAEQQRNRSQVFKGANDYDDDGLYGEKLDGVDGFAGSDAKKRKGRAAPPGRCHSCNRAETPEWRRGPDGARTLCNACGLHYAKLTRKMGAKSSTTGSNLRPKEASPGLTQ